RTFAGPALGELCALRQEVRGAVRERVINVAKYSGAARTSSRWTGVCTGSRCAALGGLGGEPDHRLVQRQRPEVALLVAAQRHRAVLRLAVADDEHVGHLAQLGLADLAADRLRAVVEVRAQPGGAECGRD